MDKFFTPKQLAEVLNVHSRTVINLIKGGKIKAVAIGGIKRTTYRIYEKELDRFMAENYEKLRSRNEDDRVGY